MKPPLDHSGWIEFFKKLAIDVETDRIDRNRIARVDPVVRDCMFPDCWMDGTCEHACPFEREKCAGTK